MIYLLVKAKSGLHAGATWKLDKHRFTFGASSNADVFLCDPGVPESLITFRRHGRKIRIEGANEEVRFRSTDNRDVSEVLLPSQTAVMDFRHIQMELQVLTASYNFTNAFGDRFTYFFHDCIQVLRNLGIKAFFGLLFLISLTITGLVLFFGTAGVVKSEASSLNKTAERAKLLKPAPPQRSMDQQMAVNAAQEMQDFAQRVGAKVFDVKVNGTEVEISAQLSRSQAIQFEQELRRQTRDYGEKIDLRAALEFTEEQKAIDSLVIERIVLGSRPALVLRDGSMLYVGGDYQGLKVMSIGARQVVLYGTSTYEVNL